METISYKDWFMSVRKLGQVSKRTFSAAWKGHEMLIIGGAITSITLALMPYSIHWLFSRFIGALESPVTRNTALWFFLGALIVSLTADIVNVVQSYLERGLWQGLQVRFNTLYFEKKGALGIDTLENPTFRDMVSKAQENLVWPILQLAEGQFMNLGNAVRLTVALGIMGAYDWKLCVCVFVALIPQFLVDVKHGTTKWMIFSAEIDTRRQFGEFRRHFANRNLLAELKLFQNVGYFLKRIQDILESFRNTQQKAEKKRHIYSGVAVTCSAGLVGLVMVVLARRVISGEITVSTFLFLWASMQSLHTTLSGALRAIAQQNEWALYAADNYAVMDAEPETAKQKGTIKCADRIPEIVFENVSFHYPWDSQERLILRGVSFKIKPGERTALVGINGAGKTTITKLLCGIHVPTSGRITIDGVDLADIDMQSWRSQLAVLFQSYANYQMKIAEVIALGNTTEVQNREGVIASAVASGAESFILDKPHGYDTMLGKDFTGGVELSVGQYQRLALARIWYRKGKVVVLDEPTASLDAFAEAQIFSELEARTKTETVILITHRLSSIRDADNIIVLDQGKISQEGNHNQLMEQGGIYAQMFTEQAKGYNMQAVKKVEEE